MLAWKSDVIIRNASVIYETEKINKGRGRANHHIRRYRQYVKAKKDGEANLAGCRFVSFSEEHLDPHGGGSISKASRLLAYLRENPGARAPQVIKNLKDPHLHRVEH
jgi:hypothetical protein